MADINELIGGYKLRTLLQTGQKSQVFEVVETKSNRHFAMKVLLPEAAADPEARRELFNDAEVGIKMAHPNVVRIFKVDRSKERPFFIMEFFPSGSLRLRLQAKDMKFVRDHARKIFKEAATGLAYMNAMGYVHRDVKPDNILVNSIGETKIIDFAITHKIPTGFEKFMSRLGRLSGRRKPQGGTPSYMSPEQIRGSDLDGLADVYSYGCTLYELTTGRKPFVGMTQQDLLMKHFTEKPIAPSASNKDLTDEFSALVLRMLAKKKEDRPNFHEFLMELRKIRIYKDERVHDEDFGGAANAPESVREAIPVETADAICTKCNHKWKVRRDLGLPAKCPKCGTQKEQLRLLREGRENKPAAKGPPEPPREPPPPPTAGPAPSGTDEIDIDAL